MEKNSPDIVHVSVERDDAPLDLVIPDFDLEVVAAGNKQGLGKMEIDASDRPLVLVESIQ
jgi:hypothetical protein